MSRFDPTYNWALKVAATLVVVCAIAENMMPTEYGRFGAEATIGMSPRLGWWLMELPCSVVFVYFFFYKSGPQARKPVPRFLAFLFVCHYMYRGWAFPYLIRVYPQSYNFSIVPAVFSWGVTGTHAYLNARWFTHHGSHLVTGRWTRTLWFKIGLLLYYTGLVLIVWHDTIQRNLRPCPNGARYCIPYGGLFEYVTAAPYFAELIAWLGFALASRGPNGLFILLVSVVNLFPRARSTHEWYMDKFGNEYAVLERRNLIPGVW